MPMEGTAQAMSGKFRTRHKEKWILRLALKKCRSRTRERRWEAGQRRRAFHRFKTSVKVKTSRAAASERSSSSTAESCGSDSGLKRTDTRFQRKQNPHTCYAKARALLGGQAGTPTLGWDSCTQNSCLPRCTGGLQNGLPLPAGDRGLPLLEDDAEASASLPLPGLTLTSPPEQQTTQGQVTT